ncbi:GNAT family N-acetyltransferase [Sphingomonas sp.]|uniref:GNAT family N-acetyltransferase n=1 Tax=Sphingomonas sp. TaxID=28214 RepID=UPI0035BBA76A
MTDHTIRGFKDGDEAAMLVFAQALPEHDLLFLGRDLRHPRVVAAWLAAIREGWIDSVVAECANDDGGSAIVGTAAVVRDPLGWSGHVGEVRLLVSAEKRGAGLGRDLLEVAFAIAGQRGLSKLTAQMTPDQTGSIALFESLGFRAEALLKNQVRDAGGTLHDLAILCHDADATAARRRAIGLE